MDAVKNPLRIWGQVETTDPDMTDRVNFGAFKFTTIDAMYQIRRCTEVLGPCGLGWGVENQRFEQLVIDPADPHYNLLMFTAQLWYMDPATGQRGSCDIAADIELFENTKNGWKRVNDPLKKVRTDALTKGLSWLGFSADVFMGRFDDQKYVDELRAQKAQRVHAKATRRDQLSETLRQEIKGLVKQAGWNEEQVKIQLREQGTTWGQLTEDQAADFVRVLQTAIKQKGGVRII